MMLCVTLCSVVRESACGVCGVVCGCVWLCVFVCGGAWRCVVVCGSGCGCGRGVCAEWCGTCARVAGIHGDVLNGHTEVF